MNRGAILFRVDGTPASGYERLSRCLTYAAALQRRRRPTFFLSQLEPRHLAFAVKRIGNNWLEADAPAGAEEDLEETIQEVRRLQAAAVIVDADVSREYLCELGRTGTLLVSLDHLAAISFPSDLLINPLLAPRREAYEFADQTQVLLGPRYALVRPEVRRLRPARAQEPAQPFRALVALGEDDPHLQTGELAQLLLQLPKVERVDMVARPQHPQLAELRQLAEAHAGRLMLASEPAEVAAKLTRCHFAVTSGSGWSNELACIGIPQLLVVQSEAHWPNAQRLEEEGVALCLGRRGEVTTGQLRQAVQALTSDPLERQAMARCGRKLIDGRGPDRLVTALEILLHAVPPLAEFSEAA
ncbi:MAG: polysaccharide biosynthesis protein [Gemmataceae bacterium]|nr:polysaccharide biosynthesis protein [Gemmataceae bacterium]MDW8263874.1 polysaccharide biosynthesis protein [Gemmataceae bacterium]